MTEEEISNLYVRLAFQYESVIDVLFTKGLIDTDLAAAAKGKFYDSLNEEKVRTSQKIMNYRETISLYMRQIVCNDMVSLTELAKQNSKESPGYVIQSWMRSRNTLEFLRQWENDTNEGFDDDACAELIHQAHTTSLTITPSLWIRRTHAVGMYVKTGQRRGSKCLIAADFHLWLDPKTRLAIVRLSR